MNTQESLSSLSADDISIGSFENAARNAKGVVVIIDVFRAFTTAAIALANGARRIIMVDDIDKARTLRDENIGRYCIGERKGIASQELISAILRPSYSEFASMATRLFKQPRMAHAVF